MYVSHTHSTTSTKDQPQSTEGHCKYTVTFSSRRSEYTLVLPSRVSYLHDSILKIRRLRHTLQTKATVISRCLHTASILSKNKMSITANKQGKAYNELLCLSEISSQDIDNDPPLLDGSIHSTSSSHDSFYQLSLGSPVQKYDDTLTTIEVVKIGRRKDRPCSALTIPNVDEINESVEEEAFSTDKPKDFTLKHSPVNKEQEDNTLNLSSIRCSFFKSIDVHEKENEPNEESKWVEFNEFEISTETTENSVYTSSEV